MAEDRVLMTRQCQIMTILPYK